MPVISHKDQFDLFATAFNSLASAAKTHSQFEKIFVSTHAVSPSAVSFCQGMPKLQTPLLFSTDDDSTTPDPVAKEVHALQNDRTRTHSGNPLTPRPAHKQQNLAFDDEPDGRAATRSPPGAHGGSLATPSAHIAGATIERNTGASDHRDQGGAKRHLSTGQPLFANLDEPASEPLKATPLVAQTASGEKAKARDIIAAIRLLNQLESEGRAATDSERLVLARFGGFGPVALSLFPDPIKGTYKDSSWQQLGEELESLLSAEDYASAKRTTFSAFYTSPDVIQAMHASLDRLGISEKPLILEPGCGTGNFLSQASRNCRFIGVELDRTSGRIARALNPNHDIRIENFRDTKLPDASLDAVIGNVPFANIRLEHKGERYALHDYFFAKSVDALKPGGVMALVTSHFTMDKQNATIREFLASKADFLGAVRLPSNAFKHEGTKVVTDILFLRRRAAGNPPSHVDNDWLKTGPKELDGTPVSVNQYFLNHPEMVLGTWSKENQLYGDEGFSIESSGVLRDQLTEAINRLPEVPRIVPLHADAEPAPVRFTRPPPLKHISEGSFFIGDDQQIYQIENGEPIASMHGTTPLKANGTMMGKRLGSLIQLRDAARLVLQSQNESWPESERSAVRKSLNQLYDRFTLEYGPVNKTTFSETKDGTVIRRMPNVAKFRDDPDAMLVMSLEDYDEVTDRATKAAIFGRDVVGPKPTIEHVTSAEEGLLVSLDQKGMVDFGFIESLYGKGKDEIIRELGDLIYLNPESGNWETADVYLSGNVRAKLTAALQAGDGFKHNAQKLLAVQPPDVLPGDIDANLGAPWIPVTDIQCFACELFGVADGSLTIGHLKKDAVWSVDADYRAEQSVAALSDYGTSRINGTHLLELALNMKSPVIYDTIRTAQGEERVVNQEETLAAKEKQKLIKEKFRNWVFAEPDRTERLVRLYNDTYNNLRPRLFDGSHLEFPGLSQTIQLRPHQKDAIWRAMSSGNTLFAHAVGAGKTFTMAATGMKLRQAGIVKKPIFVVPNHMLEQFAREFMQLYPNARLLVAGKDDMSKDRRKFLTARIASGDWDGIIATHSGFERIGMSPEYQERFLKEQIAEYEALLKEASAGDGRSKHRNLIKTIEKQKANRENKLKELAAEEKKDDGLVFDELGCDHVFIDEAHYFKNLETPTKMDRVAGIQTGGSQRSFDLFMKSRYLDELHPGHGVTFATGTPISNTMVELYNLQRFLDPRGLQERGIEHFDAWAATFGEVVETMEISPDGASLRPRSRFARFNNLPELQQMFRSFADVQTSDMLDLPRPTLKGGKPITISCPMSESQSLLQQELVERYDRLRSQKIDPRVDNALAITTDGRKLALDARMLDPNAVDDPHSKINALVDNVERIYHETQATRGTQLIFSDMGVHNTPWGFSAYDDIIQKLIARGIPREQIAAIGDAESDAKKQSLFERVRSGAVRILLGSTQKMGTGTNVQKRLCALHHLDAPWKPAEVEQRDGRILRQGNSNEEVAIYRYVTAGSFDAYMWQALETKARFISQIITGNVNQRKAEDIGGQELSYAEVKAIASGNPAVLTLAETDAELQRLAILKKNHTDDQFLIRRKIRELPETITRLQTDIEAYEQDISTLERNRNTFMTMNGRELSPDEAYKQLEHAFGMLPDHSSHPMKRYLGEHQGLRFGVTVHSYSAKDLFLEGAKAHYTSLSSDGPRAVMNALKRIVDACPGKLNDTKQNLAMAEQQLNDYRERSGAAFAFDSYMSELASLRNQLKRALSEKQPEQTLEPLPSIAEITDRIKDLREGNAIEAPAKRESESRASTSEEPIVRQLTRRLDSKHRDETPTTIVIDHEAYSMALPSAERQLG